MAKFFSSEDIALELCEKEVISSFFVGGILDSMPKKLEEIEGNILYINLGGAGRPVKYTCYVRRRVYFTLIGDPVCASSQDLVPGVEILFDCMVSKCAGACAPQGIYSFNGFDVHRVYENFDAVYDRYIDNRPCIQFSYDFEVCRQDF